MLNQAESKQLCIFTSDVWRGLSDTAVNKAYPLIIMQTAFQQIQIQNLTPLPHPHLLLRLPTMQELTVFLQSQWKVKLK